MADYNIENIYSGGYSTFNMDYGSTFTGFRAPTEQIGAPTNPMTANQIQQVSDLLQQGIVPIEIGTIKPEVFDSIPKSHFSEINNMVELAGAKISVHAPLVEFSGIDPQHGFDENQRKNAEQQLWDVVDRTAPLHRKGEMVVNAHAVGPNLPGTSYEIYKNPETGKAEKRIDKIYAVDKATGKVVSVLEHEERFFPGAGEPIPETPQSQLETLNHSEWRKQTLSLFQSKERADRLIEQSLPIIKNIIPLIQEGKIKPNDLEGEARQAYSDLFTAQQFLKDSHLQLNGMYEKLKKTPGILSATEQEDLKKAEKEYLKIRKEKGPVIGEALAIQHLGEVMSEFDPQLFAPMEDVAKDKIQDSLSNVALKSYNKYKENAPILSFENFFADMAFGTGQPYRELIEGVRDKFVEKMRMQGVSESKAKEEAERMIGITIDVGHLNLAAKKGFSKEDIAAEAKEWAPLLKHVHMTDNFGYHDSHLPPGMGSVPIKEIMEGFEDSQEKDFIVEAAGWPQHFGTSPFPHVLAGMGGEIYSGGPMWTQTAGLYQGYRGGFGELYPQVNYSTFGAQFSTLPLELGGSVKGRGGFSGRGAE